MIWLQRLSDWMMIGCVGHHSSRSVGKTPLKIFIDLLCLLYGSLTTRYSLSLFSPQLPSSMTLWSAAEASAWPSRWPKTASTGTPTGPPRGSWRWTSLNCWETVNMRWGRQVSQRNKLQLAQVGKLQCVFVGSKLTSGETHTWHDGLAGNWWDSFGINTESADKGAGAGVRVWRDEVTENGEGVQQDLENGRKMVDWWKWTWLRLKSCQRK